MTPLSNKASNGNQQTVAQNSVKLCAVAVLTDPASSINKYLSGWRIVWNGKETIDGNYAFIATDLAEETYALAIRGSLAGDPFSNWDVFANWFVEDFDVITQKPWPYATTAKAKISNGSHIAFNNLLNMQDSGKSGLSVTDYLITNAIKKGKKVIITGHSLGGNIADVYTSYFIATITKANLSSGNVSLYTFAAPAPGNGDFATDLDAKLPTAWHYQSLNDVIPNFPVAADIRQLVNLYSPAPDAAVIKFNYKGNNIGLPFAINAIADVLSLSGYKQQTNNYTKFPTALYGKDEKNTVGDWLGQAGYQHQIFNYATYLGVTLPQLASQYA